jgi:hypothetical protein
VSKGVGSVFDPTSSIKFTPKGNNYRKSSVTGQTQKDFQKIMGKEGNDEREYSEDKGKIKEGRGKVKDESYDAVASREIGGELASLFGLVKTQDNPTVMPSEEEEYSLIGISEEMQQESLSALFKGYGTKDKLKLLLAENRAPLGTAIDTNETVVKLLNHPEKQIVGSGDSGIALQERPFSERYLQNEKVKEPTHFTSREQPDLSTINPLAGIGSNALTFEAAPMDRTSLSPTNFSNIQEMIDQIVTNIYTIRVEGKTETLITLKHPPLFEGANLVITAFDTAKGEFNIAFENLTQMAKHFLEMQDNQNALRFALEDKGYVVHIITTTTLTETANIARSEEFSKGGEREGRSGSGKERREEKEQEAQG